MRRIQGSSIWLIPDPEDSVLLREWIKNLAGCFDSPSFEPHLTLLGQIESGPDRVESLCEELSREILPIQVTLSEMAFFEDYYRAIVLLPETELKLWSAREKAGRALGVKTLPYLPHVSLLYGTVCENKKRESAVHLATQLPLEFKAAALTIVRTEGDVSAWTTLKKFKMPGLMPNH